MGDRGTNRILAGSQAMSERAWPDAAIEDCRSLAAWAVARPLGLASTEPPEIGLLAAVLDPEISLPPFAERRFARMNDAMPFDTFAGETELTKRTFASGIRPGLWERLVIWWRPKTERPPQHWAQAVVMTALSAPTFLAEMQAVCHRGLRRRMLFDADGPPTAPLHPATLLRLIVLAGRPRGLSSEGWTALVALADRTEADAIGPTDALVLAEARAYYGLRAPDDPSKKGDEDESGKVRSAEAGPQPDPDTEARPSPMPRDATEEGAKHVSTRRPEGAP